MSNEFSIEAVIDAKDMVHDHFRVGDQWYDSTVFCIGGRGYNTLMQMVSNITTDAEWDELEPFDESYVNSATFTPAQIKKAISTMAKALQRCEPSEDRDDYLEWMQSILEDFDYPDDTRFASHYS